MFRPLQALALILSTFWTVGMEMPPARRTLEAMMLEASPVLELRSSRILVKLGEDVCKGHLAYLYKDGQFFQISSQNTDTLLQAKA